MSIKLTIHSINTTSNSAIMSLYDGNNILFERKNTEIHMNPDGTANTEWLKLYAKYFSFHKRLIRLDRQEEDLL